MPTIPRVEVIDELYDAIVLRHGLPLHDGRWAMATLEVCLAILAVRARAARNRPAAPGRGAGMTHSMRATRKRSPMKAASRARQTPPAQADTQLLLRHWHEAVPDDRMAHLVKDATRALVRALQARLAGHAVRSVTGRFCAYSGSTTV